MLKKVVGVIVIDTFVYEIHEMETRGEKIFIVEDKVPHSKESKAFHSQTYAFSQDVVVEVVEVVVALPRLCSYSSFETKH
jgi:hypothetical protein